MKRLIGLLVFIGVLGAGIFAATHVKSDPGYVMIVWKDWVIESSFWVGVVLVIAFVSMVLGLLIGMALLWQGKNRVAEWLFGQAHRKSQTKLLAGLDAYLAGDWKKSAKLLKQSSKGLKDNQVVPRLLAARAFSAAGNEDEALNILRVASATEDDSLTLGLTQAEIQFSSQQHEAALGTLRRLEEKHPKNVLVLKGLGGVYRELGEWRSIWALLPNLHKQKVFAGEALFDLEGDVCRQLFTEVVQGKVDTENSVVHKISEVWMGLPKESRKEASLVATYASALHQVGAETEAEKVIRSTLKKQWNDELVRLYGQVRSANVANQLSTAESWLKDHGDSAALLFALGKLATANELWGKGKQYFEESLKLDERVETCTELGRLLNHLGETSQGNHYLKLALQGTLES